MPRTVNGRKEDIVKKYGEINNWDVSNVTDMFNGTGHTALVSFGPEPSSQ